MFAFVLEQKHYHTLPDPQVIGSVIRGLSSLVVGRDFTVVVA